MRTTHDATIRTVLHRAHYIAWTVVLMAFNASSIRLTMGSDSESIDQIRLSRPLPSAILRSGKHLIINYDYLKVRIGPCIITPVIGCNNRSYILLDDMTLIDCAASQIYGDGYSRIRFVFATDNMWAGVFERGKESEWGASDGNGTMFFSLPTEVLECPNRYSVVANANSVAFLGEDHCLTRSYDSKEWRKIEYVKRISIPEWNNGREGCVPSYGIMTQSGVVAGINAGEWGNGVWEFTNEDKIWRLITTEESEDYKKTASNDTDMYAVTSMFSSPQGKCVITTGVHMRGFIKTAVKVLSLGVGNTLQSVAYSTMSFVGSEVVVREQHNGLPFAVPWCGYIDSSGKISIGIPDLGILCYQGKRWEPIVQGIPKGQTPMSLWIDDDSKTVFAGTDAGDVYRWSDGSLRSVSAPQDSKVSGKPD